MPRAYCDWNATAPILPEAAEAVARALSLGNPSSVHGEGRAARAAVEQARAEVAALIGVGPAQVTFTSGGTEAAAIALQPPGEEDVLFIGAAEHACVRAGGRFSPDRRRFVPVDAAGRLDFAVLAIALGETGLLPTLAHVALQIANNETGVINPPATFAALRARGVSVIADAVQAAGRIALQPYLPHVDFLFVSAHKIGGPKGVGALVTRADACGALRPLITGGGQEKGMRGGTENVAGIVGFGVAAHHARAALAGMGRVAALRDRFEAELRALAPDAVIFGAEAKRLVNTSLFAIPGLKAETALIAFDLDGVAVSSGAACASGKVGKSDTLAAMGVEPALAASAIRVSFGDRSTDFDADAVLASLARQSERAHARRPAA